MSGNHPNPQLGGLAQFIACLQQITQDFDRLASNAQMFEAQMRSLSLEVPGPRTRTCAHPPLYTNVPPDVENTVESQLAKDKAACKELADVATAFAQGLIQWAEQMKQRQQEQARRAAAKQPVANGTVTAEERAAEAQKFAQLAEQYSQKARDEDQLAGSTASLPDGVFPPNENDRRKQAAVEAREIAAEMKRRAYILTNGTEKNYINLIVGQYWLNDFFNNPNLNEIYAFYGKMFNDQAALNWLKLQHPAVPPSLDQIGRDVGMMALLPEFERMSKEAGESPLAGSSIDESIFGKATDIEKASGKLDNIQGDVQYRELTPEEQKTYARVEPRQSTRDAVKEKYTDEDGKFRDAVTNDAIEPGSSWVMGHKPGFEFRKMQVDAVNRGISREQFIEEQNNPNLYQPELPSTSSRRAHEALDHIQLPPGAAGTGHEDKF